MLDAYRQGHHRPGAQTERRLGTPAMAGPRAGGGLAWR
jgi:hypothetical protein